MTPSLPVPSSAFGWGILGLGSIAAKFAADLPHARGCRLVAVGSRSLDKAKAFAEKHGAERAHGSYEALLADPGVQAVYIATPHPEHCAWAIRAAKAGKHILVEKPIGLNATEAMVMIEAAREAGVLLVEAYMYRFHPQTARLVELLREGLLGELQHIEAHFCFRVGDNPSSRLLAAELGGGGILDIGGYVTSMARLVAGAARGKAFEEPLTVKAVGQRGATGVDEWTTALLDFGGGLVATLGCAVRMNRPGGLLVTGTAGRLEWPDFWFGNKPITLTRHGKEPLVIEPPAEPLRYTAEAEAVARHAGKALEVPEMPHEDTLGNIRVQDLWRAELGVVYPRERPENDWRPLPGAPLAPKRREPTRMTYGEIPGVRIPISRLVMGVDNQPHVPQMTAMFDDFVERGGNCFDCSDVYGGSGRMETRLGWWLKHRGEAFRKEIVLLDKGAHTPFCWPSEIRKGIPASLERLQTDYIDLYMMHRDNLEVPVGEFIDVLEAERRAGRIHAYGASNWTHARFVEANAYARKVGATGFIATSNNFSLARMMSPVWKDCVASSEPEMVAWHVREQMPNFAWSSQARGFFTPAGEPGRVTDPEIKRCWVSPGNDLRRARAVELASMRGVLPINIALAYVLAQPFPQFALIGPRRLAETRTTWPGLDVRLSPAEVRWLETGEGRPC